MRVVDLSVILTHRERIAINLRAWDQSA